MSLIKAAGAGEQSTGFYKHLLDQSLKFNDDDSSHLKRTPASAGNRRTWTWSAWVKRGNIGINSFIFGCGSSSSNFAFIGFSSDNTIDIRDYQSSYTYSSKTSQVFRDTSAWFHLVLAADMDNSTAADRIKLYVNGERVTSFNSAPSPTTKDLVTNSAIQHVIGAGYYNDGSGLNAYLDGYLAEINFIDGTALTPASFGETKDGIWIPKDTSGLTFGTNGFHLTFKDDVVSEGFNTVTYTGTGADNSVSGIGFSPDFVWIKSRTTTADHMLFDTARGALKILKSNSTAAEITSNSENLKSFDGDGFTYGSEGSGGGSGIPYVAWCWEAGGTPTATNSAGAGATPTAGSVKIDGSNLGSALAGSTPVKTLTANTTKGFSIVTYSNSTRNGSQLQVAHGLGATPAWIMTKSRDADNLWFIHHQELGVGTELLLGGNYGDDAASGYGFFSAVNSTTFSHDDNGHTSGTNEDIVAYCWAEVSGYSKFGTWQNNNSTTGTQVTGLGFKPAWLLVKDIDAGETWYILDNTRQPTNVAPPSTKFLIPNATSTEGTNNASTATIDFQDDGFQIKCTNPASGEISFGTRNYIYAAFADTREAAFFKDVSTNGNHFTPVNLDYRDSVPDVPTNNFATLNPLDNDSMTLSNGNLTGVSTANAHNGVGCTFGVTGGKWYWEVLSGGTGSNFFFGMGYSSFQFISQYTNDAYNLGDFWAVGTDGTKFGDSAANSVGELSYGSALSSGDILQLAFDLDNGKFYAGKNGTYFASGDPAAGSNPAFTTVPTDKQMQPFYGSSTAPVTHTFNFGQDSSFGGLVATENSNADGNGHGSFAYAPPSGFLALCSQNLPDVAIIDGTEHFNTVLYTGNNNSLAVSGVGFQPSFVWGKSRSGSRDHILVDAVRGATKMLSSNLTAADVTGTDFASFDSDGFSLNAKDTTGGLNNSGDSYVAWNWLAGTAFSNDASATGVGTIDSSGQVNTTAGFSIVSYTATGSAGTIAHGLSAAPEFIIVKHRDQAGTGWTTYYGDNTDVLYLSENYATMDDANAWNDTSPTSTVFSVGPNGGDTNNSLGGATITYCFHSVSGHSKVGSYVGNGNADGTFVYTGFRPAWIMIKNISGTGGWEIHDNKRVGYNPADETLDANTSAAEATGNNLDILSNGFKVRHTYGTANTSGSTYIYLAFADQPFKFANAR